jgi:hypothetical protein
MLICVYISAHSLRRLHLWLEMLSAAQAACTYTQHTFYLLAPILDSVFKISLVISTYRYCQGPDCTYRYCQGLQIDSARLCWELAPPPD